MKTTANHQTVFLKAIVLTLIMSVLFISLVASNTKAPIHLPKKQPAIHYISSNAAFLPDSGTNIRETQCIVAQPGDAPEVEENKRLEAWMTDENFWHLETREKTKMGKGFDNLWEVELGLFMRNLSDSLDSIAKPSAEKQIPRFLVL